MSKIILYHGSKEIIKTPLYGVGKTYNDYGQGFYCTKHQELAKEWACDGPQVGYMNCYVLDDYDLKILDLSSQEYSILNWLAILLDNRQISLLTELSIVGRDYLLDNFLPDYKQYDLIVGYRADDSYFAFARAFLSNQISYTQLKKVMYLGDLGKQYVLKSPKAFQSITFVSYEVVDDLVYFPKRKSRDEKARVDFKKEVSKLDLNGLYMRDILKEKIKNDDERLY